MQRSITELRAMAQGLGIKLDFSMSADELNQKIELALKARIPEPEKPLPQVQVPLHLLATHDLIESDLEPFIKRGLRLTFPTERSWHIRFGKKEDSGNIKIARKAIVKCAEAVMR